jgi:hypothetical protein
LERDLDTAELKKKRIVEKALREPEEFPEIPPSPILGSKNEIWVRFDCIIQSLQFFN